MATRTVTARDASFAGKIAGIQFTAGTASADDTTVRGRSLIEFAKRQGWAVNGGVATAVDLTPADGEIIARWTTAELKAYLTDKHCEFPSDATDDELRAAIRDGLDMKAPGGSAANLSAGHLSGTFPPEGAPPVSNPDKPDDAAETVQWSTPLSVPNETELDAPAITVQPAAGSVVTGGTKTVSVTATGNDLSYQWQRQTKGTGSYVDISGADEASYTTPALTVADNNLDRYRAVVSNTRGSVTSTGAQVTVTAS